MMEKAIGKITHYFPKIGVAVVKLEEELAVGERISIRGRITNFTQEVISIQSEHRNLDKAIAGSEVGMKVESSVEKGDIVYKNSE